jgi:hypothetical protein
MKKRMTKLHFVTRILCVGMLILNGCTHSLEIKNLSYYRSNGLTSFEKPVTIGIMTDVSEPEEKNLVDGVAHALGSSSAKVLFPYNYNSKQPVDVVAHIEIETVHEGSGWNFLINFPGFLVFAPAWNGYVYEVKHTINCTLTKGATKETISQFKIPIALDIRHAGFNRTWTELSWLEFGVIAFIGGLVFISYDDNVTPLVSEKTETPLGKYIAREITKRIDSHGSLTELMLRNSFSDFEMSTVMRQVPQS